MRLPFTHTSMPAESWSARLGATGIAFFLVKGLLWLLAPLLLAYWR